MTNILRISIKVNYPENILDLKETFKILMLPFSERANA